MNVKMERVSVMEHVRTPLDRTTAFAQLATYLIHRVIYVLVNSIFTIIIMNIEV